MREIPNKTIATRPLSPTAVPADLPPGNLFIPDPITGQWRPVVWSDYEMPPVEDVWAKYTPLENVLMINGEMIPGVKSVLVATGFTPDPCGPAANSQARSPV